MFCNGMEGMKGMVFGYLDILHIYLTRYMEDGDGDGGGRFGFMGGFLHIWYVFL